MLIVHPYQILLLAGDPTKQEAVAVLAQHDQRHSI
jgi:hypothetical protein